MAAKLQCEICGGKLIGKPGGIFECDSCGTEYSTEWAKAKIQEIRGTVTVEGTVEVTGKVQVEGGSVTVEGTANATSFLRRGELALEDGKWDAAKSFFDKVLNIEPENAQAYLGKLLAGRRLHSAKQLETEVQPFEEDADFKKALRFGDDELKAELNGHMATFQATKEVAKKKLAHVIGKADVCISMGMGGDSFSSVVGLKADGTVVAGVSSYGQRVVSDWADIVAVSAGSEHTVGLRADGTVVAKGKNLFDRCNVSGWRDIVAVSAEEAHTAGLKADGTVVTTLEQSDVSGWTDIVAVTTGYYLTVGLKADGAVVTAGYNADGRCDVSDWRDIVAVSAGHSHTVGLKADGTVVATGSENSYVSGWRNIVAISAGYCHTVGLKADGTVVTTDHKLASEVSGWRDIVAVAAGAWHTVGLKADGTVVTTDHKLANELKKWKLFDNLEQLQTLIKKNQNIREEIKKCAEAERKAAAEKAEAERRAAAERAEAERQRRINSLTTEQTQLQTELANLHGLFTGKRRREIEARLAEIDEELGKR